MTATPIRRRFRNVLRQNAFSESHDTEKRARRCTETGGGGTENGTGGRVELQGVGGCRQKSPANRGEIINSISSATSPFSPISPKSPFPPAISWFLTDVRMAATPHQPHPHRCIPTRVSDYNQRISCCAATSCVPW